MKKISKSLASNHDYILRPFALVRHEHVEYFDKDSATVQTVTAPVHFEGTVTGIPGLSSPIGVTDGYVLTVDNDAALWAPPTGGSGGGGDNNIDGGRADSVYLATQLINGGGA